MEWISVKDKLPPITSGLYNSQSETVLVMKKSKCMDVSFILNGKWQCDKDTGWDENTNKVTHWMPLPEAPKEQA